MSDPARVLVSGYYGFGNAGDEAILAGLLHGLRQLAPDIAPTVLSGDPAATEAEHSVAAAPRGLRSARRLARRSGLLISGGGGLLQDATSWRSPLYYLAVIRLARAARIPVACLAHGIGPLRRPLVTMLARRLLSRVDLLTVRDPLSEQALRRLGLTRPIEVAADLAFLLPAPTRDDVSRAWRKAGLWPRTQPVALIALRAPVRPAPPDLVPSLAEAIGDACDHLRLRPVLAAMHWPRDRDFSAQVAHAMSAAGALIPTPLSSRELLALTVGCDLVIAMRLHALIFAALCAVPPVAISYDPKVDALMAQLGLPPPPQARGLDPRALRRGVLEAWQARAQTSTDLRARTADLRASALRGIEQALHLLPRPQ